jgi:hypothetical protein
MAPMNPVLHQLLARVTSVRHSASSSSLESSSNHNDDGTAVVTTARLTDSAVARHKGGPVKVGRRLPEGEPLTGPVTFTGTIDQEPAPAGSWLHLSACSLASDVLHSADVSPAGTSRTLELRCLRAARIAVDPRRFGWTSRSVSCGEPVAPASDEVAVIRWVCDEVDMCRELKSQDDVVARLGAPDLVFAVSSRIAQSAKTIDPGPDTRIQAGTSRDLLQQSLGPSSLPNTPPLPRVDKRPL